MGTCRICLLNKKKFRSIHDLYEDTSYVSMLSYVGNIKVADGNNDAICSLCCRKLRDSYFFKVLIIRSEQELNKNFNIIKFDSITDVEPIIFKNICKKPTVCMQIRINDLFTEKEYASYNNTIIKRLNDTKEIISRSNKKVKNEYSAEQNSYNDDHIDYRKRKKKQNLCKISDENENKKQMVSQNICIKPKLLEGYRIIPYRKIKGQKKNISKGLMKREDICPYCGKKTRTIKTHILVHTGQRKFKCNECPRRFYTKSSLQHHVKSHDNNFIFKCEKCIAIFNTGGDLKRHMLIHTDIKEFKCHICDKAFMRKAGLNRHVLIHNTSAKSIFCDICNMSFFNNYSLKAHRRVHTGERPFKCEICFQPYSYKRDFNRHCLKKHGVILDRRPIYVMNEDILKQEKGVMKDLMLHINGVTTQREPLASFRGPQAAQAFAKAIKVMKENQISI